MGTCSLPNLLSGIPSRPFSSHLPVLAMLFCSPQWVAHCTVLQVGVFVSLVSTKIPFKGAGKEYVADDVEPVQVRRSRL